MKKNNIIRNGRIIAVASLAAVVVLGGSAFAAVKLNPSIKNHFHIENEAQESAAGKLTSSVDSKATCNGITTKITQVIADQNGFIADVELTGLPEDITTIAFEDINLKFAGVDEDDLTYYTDIEMGGISDNVAHFLINMKYNLGNKDINIDGRNLTLTLKNLGSCDGDITTFKTIKDGSWKMGWDIVINDQTARADVNKEMDLLGSKILWKDYELSPLSLKVNFDVTKQGPEHLSGADWLKYDGTDRVVVQLTNGKKIDSRFCDDVQKNWGDNYVLSFKEIINPQEVANITFGNQTIKLKSLDEEEKTQKFVSHEGMFSLTLPESFGKYLTMKETSNTNNKEIGCKDDVVYFIAHKDGVKKALFSIHRLHTDEIDKIGSDDGDPFMRLFAQHGDTQYAIKFCELVSEEEMNTYADLLNEFDSSILPGFEYLQ